MKLSSLIEKENIHTGVEIGSREEAVRFAVNVIKRNRKVVLDSEEIFNAIMERDSLGGTVFPTGLAVPHARMKEYQDLSIVIIIPRNPVDAGGVSVRCFVVMLTSAAVSNVYLQVLAQFTKLSMDETFFSGMLSCGSPEAVHNFLSEVRVKKDLNVADIMSDDFATIKADESLKALADLYYIKKTSYAAVMDDYGNFIGEVRLYDLLRIGLPNYAYMIGNLSFLSSFEPFEKLLRDEEDVQVGSIMKKALVTLKPETSVVEAALEMTQGNFRHLPVVENGRIVGILNVMDILTKVIRR